MNPLKLLQRAESVATPASDDLEAMLNALARFGEPRLCRIDGGWYCNVEMHTVVTGAQFKVASDFKHATAASAARECLQRAEAAVRAVGGSSTSPSGSQVKP